MAKTYYAEGRQMAKGITALLMFIGLAVFFYTDLNKVWWSFIVIVLVSIIIGNICGSMWTSKRRNEKKGRSRTQTAKKPAGGSKSRPQAARSSAKSSKGTAEHELLTADVRTMSGTDFERLMELYYKDQGYQVQRVGGAGDHEVDLILKGKEGYKIAVQCKRWKQDVGNDIVLRLKAGKQVHGCYDAWIVTTSNFTKAAREAAERLNIKLINGLILDDKLKKWKAAKKVL